MHIKAGLAACCAQRCRAACVCSGFFGHIAQITLQRFHLSLDQTECDQSSMSSALYLRTPRALLSLTWPRPFLYVFANTSFSFERTKILLSESASKVNWVYSGPKPILHPCFVKICSVVCNPANKPTNIFFFVFPSQSDCFPGTHSKHKYSLHARGVGVPVLRSADTLSWFGAHGTNCSGQPSLFATPCRPHRYRLSLQY